jgi:steroid 5-alpha reductase family enzyme
MDDTVPTFAWNLMLWGWCLAATIQLLLWAVQLRTRNAGLVDVGWAASLGGLALFYAFAGSGAWPDRLMIGALGGFWGGRLALHLLIDRVLGHPEEGRYVRLRAHWGRAADAHFLWFFQAQALLAAVLSLPFLLAACDPSPGLGRLEMVGLFLWHVGIIGEGIADRQLARFKAEPANRGKVCQVGLWRYSRHPNYFFEWVIWIGFALIALEAPLGRLGLIAPALILLFILKITGIPPTEKQALASRGNAYRDYQRTTSPFVPWFRREGPET